MPRSNPGRSSGSDATRTLAAAPAGSASDAAAVAASRSRHGFEGRLAATGPLGHPVHPAPQLGGAQPARLDRERPVAEAAREDEPPDYRARLALLGHLGRRPPRHHPVAAREL